MAAQICETCKNKGERCYCAPNSTCGGYEPKDTYQPSNCDIPMPQGFGEQKGWICPVCGRGLAPWVDFCPCQGSEMKITYGTGTSMNPSIYLEECFKYIDEHWDDSEEDTEL